MNSLANFLFSKITMGVLLLLMAIGVAFATFAENDFGPLTAKVWVYDATWFKAIMLLIVINIIGVVIRDKMYAKGKLTILLFHLSFIVVILGGVFTRYVGHEGTMRIREGKTTNKYLSAKTYISVKVTGENTAVQENYAVRYTNYTKNDFSKKYWANDQRVSIKLLNFEEVDNEVQIVQWLQFLVRIGDHEEEINVLSRKDAVGNSKTVEHNGVKVDVRFGALELKLPFALKLDDFIIKRYPGSESPESYESKVVLLDKAKNLEMPYRIYMNHILKHRGYRFFQSSYDNDEKGTVLQVNKDWLGTITTYIGYFMMFLGMALSVFAKKSYMQALVKASKKYSQSVAILALLIIPAITQAAEEEESDSAFIMAHAIDDAHVQRFGELLVQDHRGRIKPMYTLSSELLRKISRKTSYKGLEPTEVLLGIYCEPQFWQSEEFIKIKHDAINEILGVEGKYVALTDFFASNSISSYKLRSYVQEANRKKPAYRSKFDNEVIRADERLNILLMIFGGNVLKIFPSELDEYNKWYSPTWSGTKFTGQDSSLVRHSLNLYINSLVEAKSTGDYTMPNELLESFFAFQKKNAKEGIISEKKVKREIWYHKTDIFNKSSHYYLIFGFLLLILQFTGIFARKLKLKIPVIIIGIIIVLLFLAHTAGLILRWNISGHAPWSNGYEALIFIAWATVLAGLIFARRSGIALSSTAILAALIMHTAHLSWMDPQITNLVPVLKSYWLIIHVAIITASYSFLGLGALMAAVNLILMAVQSVGNKSYVDETIQQLTRIITMTLTVGAYMLAIGTFLGGIWANESWGRYWGWDPKEAWALITLLLYAFVLHMRMIPGLRGLVVYNIASLFTFASVIMTYFGVNYYLSGLHSYAAGDPLPIPNVIWYATGGAAVLSLMAALNQKRLERLG